MGRFVLCASLCSGFEVSAGCVWVFLVARAVDKSFVGCVL